MVELSQDTVDAIREYKLTLDELNSNNKTQINLLTILADDYKACASAIVDTIEAHIYKVPPPLKLLTLYVCDSIMKNLKGDYVALFAKKIVQMFVHVFQNGDEKIRASLYKLRVTWGVAELFVPSKMYQLDMKVNQHDSAWPITNPTKGADSKNSKSGATASTSNTAIFVNRKFMQESRDNGAKTAPRKPIEATRTSAAPKPIEEKPTIARKDAAKKSTLPLDKLLPPTTSVPSTSNAPSNSSGTKRKSGPTAPAAPAPIKKKAEVKDEDLRQKDLDLRPKKHIIPTSVAGSHAFSNPPPALRKSPPPVQLPLPPPTTIVPHVAPAAPPQTPATYSCDAVKLDIPQNNRIFVDGKAYEVMFIDDVAVIERAGAPHRIYFSGPPRNVIVDGVLHMMEFGKTKSINIDGSYHTFKFGAPSRELYIGGHPFKGQFGGSPIIATINGKRHEIRLTGSAPEVKIEPDPAYDLSRFLSKMREEKTVEIKQQKQRTIDDPFNLLKKLQRSGILKPFSAPQPMQTNVSNRMPTSQSSPVLTSPTVGIERRPAPQNLKEFQLRSLKVRYDSVVSSLLRKREDACQYCGMRMESTNMKDAKWIEHMDWHVKQNLSKTGTAKYRLWYPKSIYWLTSKADEQNNSEDDNDEERSTEVVGVVSNGQKECAICREKFEEYYDHDEEIWRFRDTLKINGKIVHVGCSTDASLVETPSNDSLVSPLVKSEVKEEPMECEDEMMKPLIHSNPSQFEQKPLNMIR